MLDFVNWNFIRLLLLTLFFVCIIDIGANLTDSMFSGVYSGSKKHPDDLDLVLKRAWQQGLQKIIITVGTLSEADKALKIANKDGK